MHFIIPNPSSAPLLEPILTRYIAPCKSTSNKKLTVPSVVPSTAHYNYPRSIPSYAPTMNPSTYPSVLPNISQSHKPGLVRKLVSGIYTPTDPSKYPRKKSQYCHLKSHQISIMLVLPLFHNMQTVGFHPYLQVL